MLILKRKYLVRTLFAALALMGILILSVPLSAIVIDISTNQVRAYIGNSPANNLGTCNNQVDMISPPRSTGSILKPFLYAAMLSDGEMLPNALLPDIPVYLSGYAPKNFEAPSLIPSDGNSELTRQESIVLKAKRWPFLKKDSKRNRVLIASPLKSFSIIQDKTKT